MTPMLPTATGTPPPALDYLPSFPENLPYEDGVPVDSFWQYLQMHLLTHLLETNWKGRRFFSGGNMFVHYSSEQVRNREFLGPDFFVALNVDHDRMRKYWAVWEESGRYPDFIIEMLSPSTALEDRTTKKDIYEQTFRTYEYVCYDPETTAIEGWRLSSHYRPVVLEGGRMWCESLALWLGTWSGTWEERKGVWLRFFDRDGKMLPTEAELRAAVQVENDLLRKENETLRQQSKSSTP